MAVSYAKLRSGGWGLRGKGLVAGAEVEVVKRSGEVKREKVGSVLWKGKDGVSLAAIAKGAGDRDWAGDVMSGKECIVCGWRERRNSRGYLEGDGICRSGECWSCYEERKMGY